jgi:GR25 family glycosyltransferase involved in LPS biosynthesis
MKQKEFFSSGYNPIGIIYYINLDHRTDRNEEFLEEMKKANVPMERIKRIPAVYKQEQGDLGCSMSHINALTDFIDSPYETCIIFEDDFQFIQPEKVESRLQDFFEENINYNVCLFAGNTNELKPYAESSTVVQISNTQTTSGYMVSKAYATILLENMKEGCRLLEKSYQEGKTNKHNQPYAIDQYWKKLQSKDKWFMFFPKMGKQRESYSDIMKGIVDPGV